MFIDPLGRRIRYLRLSLTKACPMRCVYCRPAASGGDDGPPPLTAAEIEALVAHLVGRHGLEKVRLTGGEPTSRPELIEIVQRLASIPGLRDLAMTTNGLTLARQAEPLARAGLRRVNVSLDSLERARFAAITGADALPHVLAGIDPAVRAGLEPVKLNTVVVRGHNEHEPPRLLGFAVARGLEIRFIELMPMGPLASVWSQRFVPAHETRQRLEPIVDRWEALPAGPAAARLWQVRLRSGKSGTVGFVTAMSCPFCDWCDRVRIGADGTFYPCLMDRSAGTLLPAIRPCFDPDRFDELLASAYQHKAAEHPAVGVGVMTQIGG